MIGDAYKAVRAARAYIGTDGPGAGLSVGQKLVYVDLGLRADVHGITFVSVRSQARELGMAESSIQGARKTLMEEGDPPPLTIRERVDGSSHMLWLRLPGLDGDPTEAWARRKGRRRPFPVPIRGKDALDDQMGVPVDERAGVPVEEVGRAGNQYGGVPVDGSRSSIDPQLDRPVDRPEARASQSSIAEAETAPALTSVAGLKSIGAAIRSQGWVEGDTAQAATARLSAGKPVPDPPRDEYRDHIGWLCYLTHADPGWYRCATETDQVAAISRLCRLRAKKRAA